MLGATVSTCKASCFSQINDWCSWRQWALVKHCGCSQLHDLCLWRQSALVNHPCFRSYMLDVCGDSELPPQTSIMELRNMNALQVLAVATNINHGAEKNNMLYKCSLSPRSSVMELRKTGCVTWARCRSNHQSWSCEKLDALQLLTVERSNWMIYK